MEWIDLCARHDVGFVQLLPINEMGGDDSPYNAISSVALEPLFLTMEEVPGVDLERVSRWAGESRSGPVDYPTVRRRKRELLDDAWLKWGGEREELRLEFAAFCRRENEWLADYCDFRVLAERLGGEAWESWPSELQQIDAARLEAGKHREQGEFFAWVQWLCFRQWREVRQHADLQGVRLMGDIPIGVSRSSADVFFGREDFDLAWCGGAPPETVFKHDEFIRRWGQNWGIPLYRWGKMRAEGYPWWRRRIDKLTDVFHIFRIDHVLGFYRIYAFPWSPNRNGEFLALSGAEAAEVTGGELPRWVPRPDDYETNCDANRADGDMRLRMVQGAAGGAEMVAEDLGCVPDYVRPHLASIGIPGFRIPHWDLDENDQVIPASELPECSFATYATHDHDSIPAMWEDFRRRAGEENEDEEDRKEIKVTWKALADFGGIQPKGEFSEEVFWSLTSALMASGSRYAALMITDLYLSHDRINQPGTVGKQNWSFRVGDTAAQSEARPEWKQWQTLIRETKRGL